MNKAIASFESRKVADSERLQLWNTDDKYLELFAPGYFLWCTTENCNTPYINFEKYVLLAQEIHLIFGVKFYILKLFQCLTN
jgi:hypothetical protein